MRPVFFGKSPSSRRVLFVQFANPAGYPPIEYSSEILAEQGYEVRLFGIRTRGTEALELPYRARRSMRLWPHRVKGLPLKLLYLAFIMRAAFMAMRYQPVVVYLSDVNSSPLVWLLPRIGRSKVIYHEHDSPDPGSMRVQDRVLFRLRNRALRRCAAVVAPNEERLRVIKQRASGIGPSYCVWNCPRRHAISAMRHDGTQPGHGLRVVFHGSLAPANMPASFLHAMASVSGVTLDVIGIEVPGAIGYVQELQALGTALGIADRIRFHAPLPHGAVLRLLVNADLGLALLVPSASNVNRRHMVGASNKVFDNLSQGVPVLVPDQQEWRESFVQAGVALPCDPLDQDNIASRLRWCLEHGPELRAMGAKGQELCRERWNYDRQFSPVLNLIDQL